MYDMYYILQLLSLLWIPEQEHKSVRTLKSRETINRNI